MEVDLQQRVEESLKRRQSFEDQCIHNEVVAVVRDMINIIVKEQQTDIIRTVQSVRQLKVTEFCSSMIGYEHFDPLYHPLLLPLQMHLLQTEYKHVSSSVSPELEFALVHQWPQLQPESGLWSEMTLDVMGFAPTGALTLFLCRFYGKLHLEWHLLVDPYSHKCALRRTNTNRHKVLKQRLQDSLKTSVDHSGHSDNLNNLTQALDYFKFCHSSRLTIKECRIRRHLFRCPRCALEFTRWNHCEAHICNALSSCGLSDKAVWRLSPTQVLEYVTECDRIRNS